MDARALGGAADERASAPRGTARLFLAQSSAAQPGQGAQPNAPWQPVAPGLAAHYAAYGPLPQVTAPVTSPDAVIDELRRSGLDGRGGAGFPVWRKIASVRENTVRANAARPNAARPNTARANTGRTQSKPPLVIGNGSEGEPLSRKDETLLRQAPHLVIDGLVLCGTLVGASELSLYVSSAGADSVRRAIAERADAAHVRVTVAPEAFVAGEATAVANALERGVSVPRDHPLHLSQSGVGGRPTLVQNVETLAQLALIARFGAEWFRSIGTHDEPGTRLITVSGDVGVPQVLEVPGGTPLRMIVEACAPGDLRALLVGGYHGGWVPAAAIDTALSADALAPFGASPGAGMIYVLGSARCGLESSAAIARYLADQSARQCGPCVNGLPAMASVLESIAARSRDPRLPAELARLADLVTGRGSCSHPDGTARFVLSTLNAFEADVRAHLAGGCEVNPA
jgi:NADH:ubiquinone oxidoreductase subunit F (NADH-binding)